MVYNELETETIVTRAEVALNQADILVLRECHRIVGAQVDGGFMTNALYTLLGALLGEDDTLEAVLKQIRKAATRFPTD